MAERTIKRTSIDDEMLAARRIRRLIDDLPTPRAQLRVIDYVKSALEEDVYAAQSPILPPAPDRQLSIPGTENGKPSETEELFGG